MDELLLILTTMPDDDRAAELARTLVEERLAACVNVLAPMTSTYRWQGRIEVSAERQLVMKTTRANLEAALVSQGAGWGNVVEFTTYLVHSQDIPGFMAFRTREFPRMFAAGAYPPNTLLMIDRLVQEALLIEVSAIAAL